MTDRHDFEVRTDVRIPVRDGPIRFAVLMPDGCTSNSWRVWIETSGAYICCRDNIQEIKISLHRSGRQHIAFRTETGIEMTPGSRFWNQWHEPPQQSPTIPSFKLVFPPWGVRLTGEHRNKTRSIRQKWEDNQILLKGDAELLTVVSFFVLDEAPNFESTANCGPIVIGILPFDHGKSLYVVANAEPERDLAPVVQQGLSRIDPELAQKLLGIQGEDSSPVACLSGESSEGYTYMVVVPVEARFRTY